MACDIPPLKIKETRGNALAHPQSHGLGLKMSNEVLLLNHHIKKVKPCLCACNGSTLCIYEEKKLQFCTIAM